MQLPIVYKKTSSDLVLAIGLVMFAGFFVGIFTTGFIANFIQSIFRVSVNIVIIYLLVAIGTLLWFVSTTLRDWFWEFRIEETQLLLKKLTGEIITLPRDTIQNVDWQGNKTFFYGFGKSLTFRTRNLSAPSKFAVSIILAYWVPQKSLPLGLREAIREADRLGSQPIPILREPISAQAKIGDIVLKSVEVSNDGIRYKTWLGEIFFRWEEIQVIGVMPQSKQLKIWVNNRYRRLSLQVFKGNEASSVNEAILSQVYARRIPVGYSTMRF